MDDHLFCNNDHKISDNGDIDCYSCCFFFITHDRHFPYGCRAAGFKSRVLPAKDMFEHSGLICQLFQRKKASQGGNRNPAKLNK